MENISKKVVSVEDGEVVGYVLKPVINFSELKKTGYIIVSHMEEEFFLPLENILAFQDVVLISKMSQLEFSNLEEELRKNVYSLAGENLGRVEDYVFKKGRLFKIVTNMAEIPSKNLVKSGKNVLFVDFKKKKRKFPRFEDENFIVEAMEKKEILPPVVNLSLNYYLGKVATRTLLGINKELIVKEGTQITPKIFYKAKAHNKINELYFICK